MKRMNSEGLTLCTPARVFPTYHEDLSYDDSHAKAYPVVALTSEDALEQQANAATFGDLELIPEHAVTNIIRNYSGWFVQ